MTDKLTHPTFCDKIVGPSHDASDHKCFTLVMMCKFEYYNSSREILNATSSVIVQPL